jgi:hypothetical protein
VPSNFLNTAPSGNNESAEDAELTRKISALYCKWRAIVFFWGPDGPLVTDRMPRSDSSCESEKLAAKLTQKDVADAYTCNASLAKYLT